MIAYFACILMKNFVILSLTDKGAFPNLILAWLYVVIDFGKLVSILMAFGTQLFEWTLLSSMIAY